MNKLTQQQIKAALKPLTWHIRINREYIAIHCNTIADRDAAITWIEKNMQVAPLTVGYVNRDYFASFRRI